MSLAILGLLFRAAVVLTGTALATFTLLWFAPGDPALAIAMARFNAIVPAEVIDQVRAEAGLDAGFWSAFKAWIGPLLAGDFGRSSVTGREIWPEMLDAIGYTVPLAFAGIALGIVISIPLATLAARNPGSWTCLLYTSPSPRDLSTSRMPSSA